MSRRILVYGGPTADHSGLADLLDVIHDKSEITAIVRDPWLSSSTLEAERWATQRRVTVSANLERLGDLAGAVEYRGGAKTAELRHRLRVAGVAIMYASDPPEQRAERRRRRLHLSRAHDAAEAWERRLYLLELDCAACDHIKRRGIASCSGCAAGETCDGACVDCVRAEDYPRNQRSV